MTIPRILVDTRERNLKLLNELLANARGVSISMKSGGSGDYIIVDREGTQWGIERKEFFELFGAIRNKDADGKSGKIYGQLAELKRDYGDHAILMVHEFRGIPNIRHYKDASSEWYESLVKRTVYTFISERSFAMITMIVGNEQHAAHVMLKLAKELPNVEFYGRGYKVIAYEAPNNTGKKGGKRK